MSLDFHRLVHVVTRNWLRKDVLIVQLTERPFRDWKKYPQTMNTGTEAS